MKKFTIVLTLGALLTLSIGCNNTTGSSSAKIAGPTMPDSSKIPGLGGVKK